MLYLAVPPLGAIPFAVLLERTSLVASLDCKRPRDAAMVQLLVRELPTKLRRNRLWPQNSLTRPRKSSQLIQRARRNLAEDLRDQPRAAGRREAL